MNLTSGSRIGPYEIVDRLGAGGMGEVWRATDSRLGRSIALKALPDAFAEDSERMTRFEIEARTLASLSHPNIATLHGLEEVDGRSFLVMELAEGEELGERIARGPLAVEEVASIAIQMAQALEAAHEQQIVHRDLKPANVKVAPDGSVKVLDFGLAKSWAATSDSPDGLSNSPTMTAMPTAAGVILGTAAYMSPEQARGLPVDKRSDIWSFGVVVWEMLTGRSLFAGATVSDVLASVLRERVDLDDLPPQTPAHLRALLERCLERDPKLRLRDIGEARIALSRPMEPVVEGISTSETRRGGGTAARAAAWAAAGVAVGFLTAALLTDRAADTKPIRSSISLSPAARLDLGRLLNQETIAISPNGQQIAFVALDRDDPESARQLWLRDLGASRATPVASSDGAYAPFYSPDGRWVGFLEPGWRLSRVPSEGGAKTLVNLPSEVHPASASWARDGSILATGWNSEDREAHFLWRIDPESGQVETLHRFQRGSAIRQPVWLQALPERRGVLFTDLNFADPSDANLSVLDLESGTISTLFPRAYRPRLLPDGNFLFSRDGELFLAPFDADTLEVEGPERLVLDGRATSPIYGNSWYEMADNGTLLSIPDEELQGDLGTMRLVDAAGHAETVEGRHRVFLNPRVSPSGRRLAISVPAQGIDLWVHDLDRGTQTRLSSDPGEDETPVWSPDGGSIAWVSEPLGGVRALVRRRPDGSGPIEMLWSHDRHFHASDWSPDGERILLDLNAEATGSDIWVLPLADPAAAGPLLAEPHDEFHARLSPDGRWLSYTSTETGSAEVYVRSFPALDRKLQVSVKGGSQGIWSRDGKTLFFRSEAGMWAVSVEERPAGLGLSTPRLLFSRRFALGKSPRHFGYDTLPDGRFLMAADDTSAYPRRLDLFQGWWPGQVN